MANGNRNDGMDALSALLGLGILGATAGGGDGTIPPFIKEMMQNQERMKASDKNPINPQQSKATHIDGAKAAKEIYDAYIEVGFTEIQAFELMKTVLSAGVRK